MHLRVLNSLADIPAADWNDLTDGSNPFVRHEFLSALEHSGCTGAGTGWTPQHLLAIDRPGGALLGAVPLYRKDHSYGEYVFDWAWANAYAHAGLAYYPKLVATTPFTPATGPRLLLRPESLDVSKHPMRSGTGGLAPASEWPPPPEANAHSAVAAKRLKDHRSLYGGLAPPSEIASPRDGVATSPRESVATGPRLLMAPKAERGAVSNFLIAAALDRARETGASSLHWLFTTEPETALLEGSGFMRRHGFQFHWSNPGYRDFDDFLAGFSADKRKKVRRERRAVREAGVVVEMHDGASLDRAHWDRFHEFYHATVRAHGAIPYLTPAFFRMIGEAMPQSTLLALARRGSATIGGALFFRGRDTLYGRYWGGTEHVPGLHFETCYYTAIEYCIAHGLKRFEAGAQGEHKLARGFVPTVTRSAHWLAHPQFARAVSDYLAREHGGVEHAMHELNEHVPFKRPDSVNCS